MNKKILVITTSLRSHSNSDTLAEAFAHGAKDAGNEVEIISMKDKSIGFCKGCLACQKTQKCVIHDDAVAIADQLKNAEVIAFATPVYYYGMSGQLKTLLDRCNPLFTSDYAFRSVYLLATAAEDEKTTVAGTVNGIQGWIDCFEHANLSGIVFAGGVNDAGEMKGHPALKEAYETGKAV